MMLGWILIGALVIAYCAVARHFGVDRAGGRAGSTSAGRSGRSPDRPLAARLVPLARAGLRMAAEVRELEERRALLDRPWEEDFLHWAYGEEGWQLHGHRIPAAGKRTRSVTSTGWCPGLTRNCSPQVHGNRPGG